MTAESTPSSYKPGDVVLTSYGVGVIVYQKENDFYTVRLWRIPGKSIGSSSQAILRSTCILKCLPVAPGMVTSLCAETSSSPAKPSDDLEVLVHCYYADRGTFLVSPLPSLDTDTEHVEDALPLSSRRRSSVVSMKNLDLLNSVDYQEVIADRLKPATAAKFYPILETLMDRGDETANLATRLLHDEKTKEFLDKSGEAIKEKLDSLAGQEDAAVGKLSELSISAKTVAPQAEEGIKHVLELVKDEEVTVLLERCKERLEQLVKPDLGETAKLTLEQTGIKIDTERITSLQEAMYQTQKDALIALEDVLKKAHLDGIHVDNFREEVATNFAHAFDALTTAAKSDRYLNSIFEGVVEKSSEWQEATGRLMSTRSASLFMEGASRLQARAAAILKEAHVQWAGEIGSTFTKSFTEGDAALARLKTIELGDALKDRLVEAIEVRSEAVGGLDGIIAGALATVDMKGSETSNNMQGLLVGLQQRASDVTANAHESLIAVLSSRSEYRDVALLRIENVLCTLESQIGDTLTPEEIASIAKGEGGTAKIFEPIAKRAMKQIEEQLDSAETKISDKTALEVLKRVRKIMSGELTVSSLMDEVVNVLNDDSVVAAGETIVQHGEHILDLIEGASGTQAYNDAIKVAEKAGITKDSVMQELQKLDMKDILDTAGSAVTDERARQKLLSSATDTALDFLLRILPSMPVPPFEGVKDGLVYHISNLSMEGFKVRKEDIHIELAGMRATRRASSIKITRIDSGSNVSVLSENEDSFDVENISNNKVKATELLIIDIKRISAVLDGAAWSFEQTYLPYLKGSGVADVRLSGGSIRLQFELRRKKVVASDGKERWEPVLCLHDRKCSISDVELTLQGEGRLTWILNKLAAIFKGPLRDYVVRTIVNVITSKSGWILERLNSVLSPYWELVLRTAKLQMDELVEASRDDVVKETKSDDLSLVELVWRERLPLGMNLLMNDDSGLLKVVDFPRGSQARSVCEKRGMDPELFKGATVVAVNGTEYDTQEDLFEALKDPSRPKTVSFELAESAEAERLRKFVEGMDRSRSSDGNDQAELAERTHAIRDILFNESGELGIEFADAPDNFGLMVKGFMEGSGGVILAAERSGDIRKGDILVKINGTVVANADGNVRNQAIQLLEKEAPNRPLCLTFSAGYLFHEVVSKPQVALEKEVVGGPEELILAEQESGGAKRIVIKGFAEVSGKAENSGIMIGDHLVFVNGMPVGASCRWLGVPIPPTLAEVHSMLDDKSAYPMGLTFARPRQQRESRWSTPQKGPHLLSDDEADTMCVTVENFEQLGCLFRQDSRTGDVVVADLTAVAGIFQDSLRAVCGQDKRITLSVDSLNGQFVPSYASKDMVKNAIARSWKTDGRVELCLCDDESKRWIHSRVKDELTASSS